MKLNKIIFVFIFIMLIFSCFNYSVVIAAGSSSIIIDPDTFDPSNSSDETTETLKLAGKVIGVIQTLGSIVSILAIIIIGIRYMIGSVEEKSHMKSALIPYLIGSTVLFLSVNIVSAIYDAIA